MSIKRLWVVPSICLVLSGVAFAGGEYVGDRNSFNRFHGHGVYTYTNGAVYDGQWMDGRKQGEGKQTQANGDVYEGQWRDNLQQGKGSMRWANGDTYTGEWSAGHRHGKGVFVAAGGDRYEGFFVINKREGAGVLVRKNGERFEGSWKADKRNGAGALNKPNVGVVTGVWENDQLVGDATVTFSGGDRFVGNTRNEMPHGKGVCKTKTASTPCEYRDGKPMIAEIKPEKKSDLKQGVAKDKESQVAKTEPSATAPMAVVTKALTENAPSKPMNDKAAEIIAVNSAPHPSAGRRPISHLLRNEGLQFSFQHDWEGKTVKNEALPTIFAEKDTINFGDVKIRAEGGDVAVTLVVDEYTGPGTYPLKYFKASIAKDGIASYQTAAAEPGVLNVTYDDGKTIKGTFTFVAYRNGNPATHEKKTVSAGQFSVPVRSMAKAP